MNLRNKIIVLTTGGTIEKEFDERQGALLNRKSFFMEKIQDKLRLPNTEIEVHSVFAKDSKSFSDNDRINICKKILILMNRNIPIVVLHGTDTLVKTAKLVYNISDNIQVPLVFTGAMRPLEFEDSDALQNLTESFIACKLLRPGVYLCFHGSVFDINKVKKNYSSLTFEVSSDQTKEL